MSHFHLHPEVFPPRKPSNLNTLPVEYHLEILFHMLVQPGGTSGRFGDWWAAYISPHPNDQYQEALEIGRRFHQRSRHYRTIWHQHNRIPPNMRNHFRLSPIARAVWERHWRSLIRDALQALADKYDLGPGNPVDKDSKVAALKGLYEWNLKQRLGLDARFPYVRQMRRRRGLADMLYLQELQYNLFMTSRDREGRPDRSEIPISENQPVNRIPPEVHERILFHLFACPSYAMYNGMEASETPQRPWLLREYFSANSSAEQIWNSEHGLNIISDTTKVVRRQLEAAWQQHDEAVLGSRGPRRFLNRYEGEEVIRRLQRDMEYLEAWKAKLEADGHTRDKDKSKETDEYRTAMQLLMRNPDGLPRSPTPSEDGEEAQSEDWDSESEGWDSEDEGG
jgi:hypothetical protein